MKCSARSSNESLAFVERVGCVYDVKFSDVKIILSLTLQYVKKFTQLFVCVKVVGASVLRGFSKWFKLSLNSSAILAGVNLLLMVKNVFEDFFAYFSVFFPSRILG